MKRIAMLVLFISLGRTSLFAMPAQITFQGTLKQKGVPVNTTKNMQFNFVDASGASIPGTVPISVANVQVTNGLFAVQLPIDPTINWQQFTPFIQVSVEGQILAPNQPLNANLYAVAAIPQGMVAMFPSACPGGWTPFAPLNDAGAFPRGGATYGATGGSATHSHSLGLPTHVENGDWLFGNPQGSGSHPANFALADHVHSVSTESNLPPFVTMVFCEKQ
jgi:hypothetical protein